MQNRRELGELLDDGGSLTKRRRASESDESPTPASDTFENSTVPLAASALGNDQDDSGSDWMDIMNEPTDSLEDPPAGLLVEGDDVPKLSGQVVRNSVISQVWSPDVGKVVGNEAPKGIEATYEWLQFLQDGCGGGGDGNAFALDCPSDWAANSTTRVRPAAFRSAAQQPISSSASLTVDSSSDEAEVTGAHKAIAVFHPAGLVQPCNIAWQSGDDSLLRKEVVINIFQLFLGHKASATAPLLPELHTDKLPNLVRRLEEAMYRKAPSKEAYADPSTMRQRVMDVVVQLLQARAAPPAGPTPPSPAPNAKPGYETRRQLVIQIYKLFTCSSHWAATLTPAFKDQLPSFVRRLEMALYHSAASEAEYIDTTTLEARLFSVSQRLVRKDQ